jgi:RNA polymerase sigma factor (sigma-70 family)
VRTLDLRNSLIEGEAEALDASISPEFTANSGILVSRVSQVHLPSETSREAKQYADKRLELYFLSVDEHTSQEHLEYLLESIAKPIIHRIVQRSTRVKIDSARYELDSQDVVSDVLVRILARLNASKADPQRYPISNFDGLVATISYRVIADLLRTRNRQRTNLEKKIRRLFAANADLSIWEGNEKELVCGYAACRSDKPNSLNTISLTSFELSTLANEIRAEAKKRNTAELILLILQKVKHPIRLRDLVGLISEITFVQQLNTNEVNYSPNAFQIELTISNDSAENRRLLERLFVEIKKLEIEQRRALLLNMTDSYGYSIEWFLFTRIATEAELADLLQLSVDEFRRLLNALPMTDKEIAKLLGVSPTKVANIRKAVRERLARCRKAFLRGE